MSNQTTITSLSEAATPLSSPVAAILSNGAPVLISAGTLSGDEVVNRKDESLGSIKELMLHVASGRVAYAVLSYGGFLGMGDKLFAVPWSALTVDGQNKRVILNVEKDRLADAPGFDKDAWPNMNDTRWAEGVHSYYGTRPIAFDALI